MPRVRGKESDRLKQGQREPERHPSIGKAGVARAPDSGTVRQELGQPVPPVMRRDVAPGNNFIMFVLFIVILHRLPSFVVILRRGVWPLRVYGWQRLAVSRNCVATSVMCCAVTPAPAGGPAQQTNIGL